MLNVEDEHAMVLRQLPQSVVSGKGELGDGFGEGIKQKVESPIKHLDEEGEFGQNPRMDIVGKAGRIGRAHHHTAAVALLRRILGRDENV